MNMNSNITGYREAEFQSSEDGHWFIYLRIFFLNGKLQIL